MKTPSRKRPARKKKPHAKKTAFGMVPVRKPVEFPEVKGKTIEAVKLYLETDDTSLSLIFSDKTHLWFDLEPGLTVRNRTFRLEDPKLAPDQELASAPPRLVLGRLTTDGINLGATGPSGSGAVFAQTLRSVA